MYQRSVTVGWLKVTAHCRKFLRKKA